jgi:glycosyltransferase involved in cell wall biosynthesis
MDLICLSHLRWGFVFQRPNHLMSRFARVYRTFFFEEPVFDDDDRDAWLETYEPQPGLTVCVPHLPKHAEPAQDVAATRRLLHQLIAQRQIQPAVLWFYTPMALKYAHDIKARLVIYDCMDELSAFLHAPREVVVLERKLLSRADLVFTGGQALYEAKRGLHPAIHAFPSSVDATHFERARLPGDDPSDQRDLPKPRIGYFGVIDERLDLSLIEKIAYARPDWQVVMLGPVVKIVPGSLPRARNLHWLGAKTYAELPSYIAHWEVALMPFALNEATRFISPTKTLEYLAAGKPVVSTAIADVVRPYGDAGIVRIADDASVVGEIELAMRRTAGQLAEADAFVAETSWDRTWNAMHSLMLERLTPSTIPAEGQLHV